MVEGCGAVLNILLFITCVVDLSSAVTHSLQYLYTVTGKFTAVGLVDGQQIVYYDSNIRKMIPKTEWMKKVKVDDPNYWDSETRHINYQLERFEVFVDRAKQRFNHNEGDHTVQRMYGCELDDDGTTRGYDQYGYDGGDFISLNLSTGTWTTVNVQAKSFINNWDPSGDKAKHWKNFLETNCIDYLKKFQTLERKVDPEVSLFQKHSPSPEVVCHATGFFPKPLNITWQKDGEDVHEDVVEIRETLPNQDGSFQKRSILKVPAEELQKHNYTCVVQHSSLEKELVREVPKGGGSDGGPNAVIITVIVVLSGLIVVAVIVVMKKKNSCGRTTGGVSYSRKDGVSYIYSGMRRGGATNAGTAGEESAVNGPRLSPHYKCEAGSSKRGLGVTPQSSDGESSWSGMLSG